jgi:hypothetical protein
MRQFCRRVPWLLVLVLVPLVVLAACGSSPPPQFLVQHTDSGDCRPPVDACVVTAVLQNIGGDGSGRATVGFWEAPDGPELTKCQTPIPRTAATDVVTVSCQLTNLRPIWQRLDALSDGFMIQVGVVP